MLPIIYSDNFLSHKTGSSHPERPQRLTAIVEAVKSSIRSDLIDWQLPTPTEKRDVLPFVEKIHRDSFKGTATIKRERFKTNYVCCAQCF